MANQTETLSLPAGSALTVVTAGAWVGNIQRLGDKAGDPVQSTTTLGAGSTSRFGPYPAATWWQINQTSGSYTYTAAPSFEGTTSNVGTAASGVLATEYGDGRNHVTVLTVANKALPAIAGGANLGVGSLLYTFPAGVDIVHGSRMSASITQTEGNITADTPDGGLGTTIASGAVAVLGGTAAFENVLTGQTFNDCNGTAEAVAVGTQLVIQAADNHTLYFNVADGWAASGDAGALLNGTFVIFWTYLG